ncbi:MAG: RNA 2',3'-cyclic phosphodiesterase [Spirochaetia bacterium]|nr:RNA 2',3'-cyclic phosphodiesterase [Spirochaetia bacterium]
MRLFVAVDIPQSLKTRLADMCRGIPGVRWTPEEQMHITIRFLGETHRTVFEEVAESLHGVLSDPFELRLRGVGQFLRGNAPQVLWAGVDDGGQGLAALHGRVEAALSQCGIAREKRRFHPHVTLGRPGQVSKERVEQYLLEYHDFESEPFSVTEFVLYSSRLTPEGAVHTPEVVYEFAQ